MDGISDDYKGFFGNKLKSFRVREKLAAKGSVNLTLINEKGQYLPESKLTAQSLVSDCSVYGLFVDTTRPIVRVVDTDPTEATENWDKKFTEKILLRRLWAAPRFASRT